MARRPHPDDEPRIALQSINWVFFVLYTIVATYIFWSEQGQENFFYDLPFRYYFGSLVVPAYLPIWFGFLIGDLFRQFRWPWLAMSLGAGFANIIAYNVISWMTVLPG